ncbi:hypothetical protein DDP54_09705 [Cellulomonas sp. WB94]|uniref:hypothetical protein n=1 Tax=Cellulomonas sp. WB94 TaxID=2173174 RepID=UPI000D580BE7|nr:hypothetical protein [Cellulomonas sp. WB94]PVU83221.1 hypothetical protein DDP54_09705 [Cellulomonas sp. WB94]
MGVLRPEGSLPARVYWVRRLVVLAAIIAVVLIAAWAVPFVVGKVGDLFSGATDAAPGPTTTTSAAAVGPQPCAAEALGLTLAADGASYAASALPTFTVTLVNNGADGCVVDAGDAQREIVIMSGTDRIWSSRDCASGDALTRELLLAPGAPDATTVQWQRTRSAAGCPGDQPAALKGTYSATLTLAGVTSQPAVFVLE